MHLENGLHQGSSLSPLLYILYTHDLIIQLLKTETGIKLGNGPNNLNPTNPQIIPCLMFVDDLITYSTSLIDLQKQLKVIQEYVFLTGTVININKSSLSSTEAIDDFIEMLNIAETLDLTIQELDIEEIFIHLGHKYNPHI